jgi:hypothetical protein
MSVDEAARAGRKRAIRTAPPSIMTALAIITSDIP